MSENIKLISFPIHKLFKITNHFTHKTVKSQKENIKRKDTQQCNQGVKCKSVLAHVY